MSPINLLKQYYIGRIIGEGTKLHPVYIGWKIVDIALDSYEPMLDLVVTDGNTTKCLAILFEWDITGDDEKADAEAEQRRRDEKHGLYPQHEDISN
jgi:hypothetical protein